MCNLHNELFPGESNVEGNEWLLIAGWSEQSRRHSHTRWGLVTTVGRVLTTAESPKPVQSVAV